MRNIWACVYVFLAAVLFVGIWSLGLITSYSVSLYIVSKKFPSIISIRREALWLLSASFALMVLSNVADLQVTRLTLCLNSYRNIQYLNIS
jgi:hypothetical protein